MEEGCSCLRYEYALSPDATSEKVFAIRRQGSEEVEELCLSIDQAHIIACQKQATELLKCASVCDRVAVRSVFDTCLDGSFEELHSALKDFKISPASSSSSTSLQTLAVYEIIEVAADAAVTRPNPMHCDAQLGVEGIVEEWIAKKKNNQTKVYRVVCCQECETPTNQVYGSKQEAYAVAIVKLAALGRKVAQSDNVVEEREDCLSILEDMQGKPLEEQHRALLKRTEGLVQFHVEELVMCSSASNDADTAVAIMMERAVSLLRNREETIYLVKSSRSLFGRSRARHAPSCIDALSSEDKSKTILHAAFRDSEKAYSLALVMQVRNILQHAADLAYKEPIGAMLARLTAAEEPKEEAFGSLKSWIMEEMVHLTSNTRSFTVQKFVVKNFLEKNSGIIWQEIEEQFSESEKQFEAEESVNS